MPHAVFQAKQVFNPGVEGLNAATSAGIESTTCSAVKELLTLLAALLAKLPVFRSWPAFSWDLASIVANDGGTEESSARAASVSGPLDRLAQFVTVIGFVTGYR